MADTERVEVDGAKRVRLHTGKYATVVLKRKKKPELIYEFEYGEESHDDSATLKSLDGSYEKTVKFSEGQKLGTKVQLKFPDIVLGKKYELTVDPGSSGDVYKAFTNQEISAANMSKKDLLCMGRFLDAKTEAPLAKHWVYVDTPGDNKVEVTNKIKTSNRAGVGGWFMPGKTYNFHVVAEEQPVEDVEKLSEADLHKLTASAPHRSTCVFKLEPKLENPKLVGVDVVDGLPIADAKAPHTVWDPEQKKATREEPALILHNTKLKLKTKFKDGAGSGKAKLVCLVKDKAGKIEITIEKEIDRGTFGKPFEVELETPEEFTKLIAVHELQLKFSLDEKELAVDVPLRIYTGHKNPIQNTQYNSPLPHVCKSHLEHACRWANGASENVGEGAASIPYQVDNQMRHFGHPSDWGSNPEFASVYSPGDGKPTNYDDLPPQWGSKFVNGRRKVSALYYPPLEPKKDYEKYYPHYENNFGWRLLDNKTHTGGRCNQQASLICEIFGVLGIKAEVYYLQRVGVGKKTGRRVRNYFNCYSGGQFWNFHGIVKTELDDGTYHMYDGSFSSPPNRKNGSEKWAIGERGPFIYSWEPFWKYEKHDVSDYFHNTLLKTLFDKLDSCYPEFGWKKQAGGWVASNDTFCQSKFQCDAAQVAYGGGWSFRAGSKDISWLSWVANGGRKDPEGSASMDAAKKLATKVGLDPNELVGAVPAEDTPDTWEGVPKV